jgi:hypothetical protein
MNSEVQELDMPAQFTPAGEAPVEPLSSRGNVDCWAKVTLG